MSHHGDRIVKVAVSGKGGVGKTLIAAGLASYFAHKGLKTVAIDADPSPNLALTLGLSPEASRKIVPLSENKRLIESKTGTGYSGVFKLNFRVDDVARHYSMKTPFGVNLIVMGTVQSMGSGCTCAANAVVRALLRHLIVESDEFVILDMEAGVEHIGRATAKNVDIMLVVSDANMKALETAKHISELAEAAPMKHVFLVGNKVADKSQREVIEQYSKRNKLSILHHVPFDSEVIKAEANGKTPLNNKDSEAIQSIEELASKLTMHGG